MRRAAVPAALLVAAGLAAGCHKQQTTTSRSQVADDFSEKLAKATVGDKTVVSNTEPIPVSGVGLVYNLPGTGSTAKAPWREFLEKGLRQKQLKPSQFLDDPTKQCSLVLLSAVIPAGSKKGDPVDVEITLPPGSESTSLKGGVLFECELYPYDQAGSVRDKTVAAGMDVGKTPVAQSDTILLGQPLVRAAGPLVAGTDGAKADEEGKYRVAMVWGGGRFLGERAYWFELSDEKNRSARMAGTIAARLNEAFPTTGGEKSKVANAVNERVVAVRVPMAYRLNHGRFLMVARQVPMAASRPGDPRRAKYEQELLDPATAIPAAIKLEALGTEVQGALRVGLENPSPWVRFAAAEALAYLGNTAGSAELAKLAETHPGLRSHCLTALGTLDDGVSTDRLAELMTHPDPQLRYGAFVALRSANPQHAAVNGRNVKGTYWVHHVAPESPGMVHLASRGRSEVVLFGNVGTVSGPFSLPVGPEFVVSTKAGEEFVRVSRIVSGKEGAEPVELKAKPALASVLTALGELGGGYAEAVEFLKKADSLKAIKVAIAVDAAPRGIPLTQLATIAKTDPGLETANLEVARASRGDVQQASFDLPSDEVAKKPLPVEENDLSRNPGRIFGGKKHPQEVEPEPVKPAEPAKPDPGDLSRNPGKLFGK